MKDAGVDGKAKGSFIGGSAETPIKDAIKLTFVALIAASVSILAASAFVQIWR